MFQILFFAGCTKRCKFEKLMIVQTHGGDRENGGFFLFFFKKRAIQCKIRKILHFPYHRHVFEQSQLFHIWSFWYNQRIKKYPKHSNFLFVLKILLVCLFPTNIILFYLLLFPLQNIFCFCPQIVNRRNTCFFDLSKKWFLTKIWNRTCCMNKKICGKFK